MVLGTSPRICSKPTDHWKVNQWSHSAPARPRTVDVPRRIRDSTSQKDSLARRGVICRQHNSCSRLQRTKKPTRACGRMTVRGLSSSRSEHCPEVERSYVNFPFEKAGWSIQSSNFPCKSHLLVYTRLLSERGPRGKLTCYENVTLITRTTIPLRNSC